MAAADGDGRLELVRGSQAAVDSPLAPIVGAGSPAAPLTVCRIPGLDAEVVVLRTAWDAPIDLAPLLADGRRRLVVSVAGEQDGVWLDGPLAHLALGGVASYVPAGGPAVLSVPAVVSPELRPKTLAAALAAEGTDDERAHRCMLARVAAWLDQGEARRVASAGPVGGSQGQKPPAGGKNDKKEPARPSHPPLLTVLLDGFRRADAVALALIRQAWPMVTLVAAAPAGLGTAPPPWRRFCENAGVRSVVTPSAAGAAAPIVELAAASALIPAAASAAIARSLNSTSTMLPKSLA